VSRIVIVGGPKTGKTTVIAPRLGIALAARHGTVPIRHTDDLIPTHGWSAASAAVALWFDAPGPWVIEGVAVPRALRKWLDWHRTGKPCDEVITAWRPLIALDSKQAAMAKGVRTVWDEIWPQLVSRGLRPTNRG
jgi:hypothetical protein